MITKRVKRTCLRTRGQVIPASTMTFLLRESLVSFFTILHEAKKFQIPALDLLIRDGDNELSRFRGGTAAPILIGRLSLFDSV